MRSGECPRHDEALEAVRSGRWPDAADDDLSAHVAACEGCGEVVEIAAALRRDFDAALRTACVPPSGAVWWRASMRAREERGRSATRPISLIQGLALGCGIGAGAALLAAWSGWLTAGAGSLMGRLADLTRGALRLLEAAALTPSWVVLVVFGAWLVLAPVAIYFVVVDE